MREPGLQRKEGDTVWRPDKSGSVSIRLREVTLRRNFLDTLFFTMVYVDTNSFVFGSYYGTIYSVQYALVYMSKKALLVQSLIL
jgi:hypothetical protein